MSKNDTSENCEQNQQLRVECALGVDRATIAAQQAELQRGEAKLLLNHMFGIPDGYGNGTVERIVDCIIGAALLEMVSIQSAAQKHAATSDNP